MVLDKQMRKFNLLCSEIDAAYHDASRKLGLADSTMMILYAVCSFEGECLLSDIMRISGLRKQTVNSALRKLESDDIVSLEVFRGKKKKVSLTDQGHELVKRTVFPLMEIENEIVDSWTKEEWETYMELTRRFLDAFKEKVGKL